MKLKDLSAATLDCLRKLRYDCIIEKHEGPEKWSWLLEDDDECAEIMMIDNRPVLLPVPHSHLPKMSVLRCVVGDDEQTLTLFLKDTTYVDDPRYESLTAGFIAICDKLPGDDLYVAMVYHEWFISAGFSLSRA